MERIQSFLDNLVHIYKTKYTVDEDDPYMVILPDLEFKMSSTEKRLKGYTMGQWIFGRYKIIPIKHKEYW